MERISPTWLRKRAELINTTLGVQPDGIGAFSVKFEDGKAKAYRATWRGGSHHLMSGTRRELNMYLDGILEGVRSAAAHQQHLQQSTDPDRTGSAIAHGPCPAPGCALSLVTQPGVILKPLCPAHGYQG